MSSINNTNNVTANVNNTNNIPLKTNSNVQDLQYQYTKTEPQKKRERFWTWIPL